MNQCIKISFSAEKPKDFLDSIIKKNARNLGIEGTVQASNTQAVNIVACSTKEILEEFLDVLHKEAVEGIVRDILVEPFMKHKDYRGVFRIID